jgi:hypothetical protein
MMKPFSRTLDWPNSRDGSDQIEGRQKQVPAQLRLGSPIARPSKIVCVGLNFHDHAAESKMPSPAEPDAGVSRAQPLLGGRRENKIAARRAGWAKVKAVPLVSNGKVLTNDPAKKIANSSTVYGRICPNLSQKSSKMGVEFSLQTCKKRAVKILGTLPDCKLNLRKG